MRVRATLAVLAALLVLGACTVTTHSTSCRNDVCSVQLTGEQTVDVGSATEQPLMVGPIESDAVTVSSRGDTARIGVGKTATVSGMIVRVVSVSGRDINLEIKFT